MSRKPDPDPIFFESPKKLRAWLVETHAKLDEAWIGLWKKGTGKPSITWPELVDQLLCFGWIDGVRRSVDDEAYMIRVTPRRKGSKWSAVNLKRARELIEEGLMEPAGRAAYDARDERDAYYTADREKLGLGDEYEAELRANRRAWAFFRSQPPGYRRNVIHWVISAKREETRRRRLATLISDSEQGLRIAPLRR